MLKISVAIPVEVNDLGVTFGFLAPSFLEERSIDRHLDYRFITNDAATTMSELIGDIKHLMCMDRDRFFAVCVMGTEDLAETVYSVLENSVGFESSVDLSFDDPEEGDHAFFFRLVHSQESDLLRRVAGSAN